jgi:hypothetical protein
MLGSLIGPFRPSALALQWKGIKKDPRNNLCVHDLASALLQLSSFA